MHRSIHGCWHSWKWRKMGFRACSKLEDTFAIFTSEISWKSILYVQRIALYSASISSLLGKTWSIDIGIIWWGSSSPYPRNCWRIEPKMRDLPSCGGGIHWGCKLDLSIVTLFVLQIEDDLVIGKMLSWLSCRVHQFGLFIVEGDHIIKVVLVPLQDCWGKIMFLLSFFRAWKLLLFPTSWL